MKAVIIEDEDLIARELVAKLRAVASDIEVISVLPSLKTARKWFFENAEPDVLFMDIQLSDGVSFELFDLFTLSCPVVFTTAYDEYAIRAFKVNGVDYLLKPMDNEELTKAVDKCRRIVDSKSSFPVDMKQLMHKLAQPASKSMYKEKFIVSFQRQWFAVDVKDIACFMKDGLHYIITFTGEKHILDFTSMEEIEELLDPALFYRANRQYIVHIDAIKSVLPQENQKLTLTLKAPNTKIQIDMSRERAPEFKRWMDR